MEDLDRLDSQTALLGGKWVPTTPPKRIKPRDEPSRDHWARENCLWWLADQKERQARRTRDGWEKD